MKLRLLLVRGLVHRSSCLPLIRALFLYKKYIICFFFFKIAPMKVPIHCLGKPFHSISILKIIHRDSVNLNFLALGAFGALVDKFSCRYCEASVIGFRIKHSTCSLKRQDRIFFKESIVSLLIGNRF